MSAPLSVIIPTLNAAGVLGTTLAALGEAATTGLLREVIFTDGGSTDGTDRVAEDVGAVWITGPASRGGQLRRGAETARGDWLLFLHADTVLAEGWDRAVFDHLSGPPDRAAAFRLRFDAEGFAPALVARWANLRSRALALPYGDQGLLISRLLYDRVGGYADMPLMEDVEIAGRLRGRIDLLPLYAVTRADRYRRDGWLRRGWRNLSTLALYKLGKSPEALAARYRRGQT
ncbi:MAG: TIGR04283 family arsenosugar biosynthesis glycosyltransferase [Pseudomonadota bacterium]